MIYDRKRFWCSRDAAMLVDLDGYLVDPESAWGSTTSVVPFAQLQAIPCLILLGEPGIGKSTAVKDIVKETAVDVNSIGDSVMSIDLRSHGNESRLLCDLFETGDFLSWGSRIPSHDGLLSRCSNDRTYSGYAQRPCQTIALRAGQGREARFDAVTWPYRSQRTDTRHSASAARIFGIADGRR